ncbi:OmpA family protein [Flavobacterium sp. DG1-102-2]|uniref:OmpA family protein n=1 Tax=Flavobacterium sp. DG1-102-2 TaxID=3081663 RepID=UPI0029494290|nr:OmpA family protein [Flavobacterium sp. DG1-102-2]MDV6170074.1 OmpA family protein [Flavobacterium sp. DG1-102-2]
MKLLLPIIFLLCLSANAQQDHEFTIYFDSDADVPTEASKAALAEWMESNKNAGIHTISGYTDTIGNTEYNRRLSIRRIQYLIFRLNAGYMRKKWKMMSYGETQYTSGTDAENRKAVITYTKQQKTVTSGLTQLFKEARAGEKIILRDINFVGGTSFIVEESKPILKELYIIMRDNPKLKIDIQGHICCSADDTGDLSKRRAMEVFVYLHSNGINGDRLSYRGFGGSKPMHKIPERNKEEMAENRRVEIEILAN